MGKGASAADWRWTVVTKFYELRYSYGLSVQSSTFLGCVGTWDYELFLEKIFLRGERKHLLAGRAGWEFGGFCGERIWG